jgi:hypothetical protein
VVDGRFWAVREGVRGPEPDQDVDLTVLIPDPSDQLEPLLVARDRLVVLSQRHEDGAEPLV